MAECRQNSNGSVSGRYGSLLGRYRLSALGRLYANVQICTGPVLAAGNGPLSKLALDQNRADYAMFAGR